MPSRLVVGLLVFALFVGCQDSTGSGNSAANNRSNADGAKRYRIAVIPKGTTHEFWRAVHAGAANAAKQLGDVEVLWKGPQLESDKEGQITIVENFITSRVDGICLAPNDSQALVDYVNEAAQEKIPVVIFDSGINDESKIVTYVASDNYNGGVLAARRMAEALHEQGNAILLRYFAGSESTERREQGFLDELKKHPKMKILSADQYSGATPEESLTRATQVLNKFKSEVNGIFAVCEPNAAGTLGALQETELAGKVAFIAFDPNADLIRGLESKKVQGIVLQDPVKMGYEAVMAMHKHLKGEKVPKRINTGETVATPENLSQPRIQQLLKPEQFQD